MLNDSQKRAYLINLIKDFPEAQIRDNKIIIIRKNGSIIFDIERGKFITYIYIDKNKIPSIIKQAKHKINRIKDIAFITFILNKYKNIDHPKRFPTRRRL